MTSSRKDRGAALVTGAARRIGRAIALDLGRAGWRVAVHYGTSRDEAEAVAAEIRAIGTEAVALPADLAKADELERLIADTGHALGPLTCLVNNASLFLDDRIETLDAGTWDRHLDANLRAPVLLAHHFARQLPAGQKGNIVNILDQRVLNQTPVAAYLQLIKTRSCRKRRERYWLAGGARRLARRLRHLATTAGGNHQRAWRRDLQATRRYGGHGHFSYRP